MSHPIYKIVAKNVKALMRERKVRGYQLAKIAEVSETHMSEIFTGSRYFKLHQIIEIAKFFKVKPEVLLKDNEKKSQPEYVPFSEEWKKEMMKLSKTMLARQFEISQIGKNKPQMIDEIKFKLMTDNSINQ